MKNKNKQKKQKDNQMVVFKESEKRMSTVKAPVAVGTLVKGARAPKVNFASDGSCTIAHSEYVQDVTTAVSGVAQSKLVNPQSADMFTWLSAIGSRFEMFRFKKLRFRYKTSSSTTQDGFVILGFDFDVYDDNPSKAVMLTWKYNSKSPVWSDNVLDVSADTRMSTWRYCNYLNLGAQGDSRLDYIGKLLLLCNSSTDNLAVGELFVDYVCEFRQPSYKLPTLYSESLTSPTWTTTNAFFAQPVAFAGNMPVIVNTANKIIIPNEGEYLISAKAVGSGISSNITIVGSQPIDYPNAEWTLTDLGSTFTATLANSTYVLKVPVGGVLLTFSVTGATVVQSFVRFATYFLGA